MFHLNNFGTNYTPYKRATAWCHFTNLSCGVNVHYLLRNMFSKIFSLGKFHNSPNFLPPMCSCNEFYQIFPLPTFPSIQYVIAYSCMERTVYMNRLCKHLLQTLNHQGIFLVGLHGTHQQLNMSEEEQYFPQHSYSKIARIPSFTHYEGKCMYQK